MSYPIPEAAAVSEEEIKRSRFITYLAHTPGVEAAKSYVKEIKVKHADARHNCWAFVAGAPDNSMLYGSSDDGEPSGTAGRPILAQLKGSGIGEITAVITRYSGGIKLGTGGLVKAYGGGVRQALEILKTHQKLIVAHVHFQLPFALTNLFEHKVALCGGNIVKRDYGQEILATVEIAVDSVNNLTESLIQQSKGRINVVKTG